MTETIEIVETVLLIISSFAAMMNLVILGLLFKTFFGSYRKLKAKFTKGLLTFVGFLIVQQFLFFMGLAVNLIFRPEQSYRGAVPMFLMISMELVALIIFYRTTRE
jgi:hypothetical protein